MDSKKNLFPSLSTYAEPGSKSFQKASKARILARKLSKLTQSRLDGNLQALLTEVTNRSEMRSFYHKGKMHCTEDIQTDNLDAEFQDMRTMAYALRDDFHILYRIGKMKQQDHLKDIENQLKTKLQQTFHKRTALFEEVLEDTRIQCEDQFWEALDEISNVHEIHHQLEIEKVLREYDLQKSSIQQQVEKAQIAFQKIDDQFQKLKFESARIYVVLKKHDLLSAANLSNNFADEERIHLVEKIKNYQDMIREKDEEIQELKMKIAKAETVTSKQNTKHVVAGRLSIVPDRRESTLNYQPPGARDNDNSLAHRASIAPRRESFIENNISNSNADDAVNQEAIKEMEKLYADKITSLKRQQKNDLQKYLAETLDIERIWETKVNALFKLQRPTSLQKIIEKQVKMLGILSKAKIKKPLKDQELSIFLEGKTLYSLTSNRLNESETDLELSQDIKSSSSNSVFKG